MVKKGLNEVTAYAKRIKGRVITSWEAHLPSRDTLLKSLCNSGEKKRGQKFGIASNPSLKPTRILRAAYLVR